MGILKRFVLTLLIGCAAIITSIDDSSAVTIEPGPGPGGPTITGPYAYITNYSSNNVSVIDTATDAVLATIAVGLGPYGVTVSPDATRVYVANYAGNSVSVINATNNSVLATVPIATRPYGLAISPDGRHVYVVAYYSNTVSVIDTATNTVTATIPVGQRPHGVVVSRDNKRVYVANYATNDITVIDATLNSVAATIALPANSNPFGLAQTLDSSKLYVTGWSSNAVYVVDTASKSVTATIPVGIRPVSVAVTPDASRVYVSNYRGIGVTTVSVIDPSTHTVVTDIPLPSGVAPSGVSVHPDGGRVYVASYSTGSVFVIDPASNTILKTVTVGTRPYAFGSFISQPQPSIASAIPFAATNNPTPTLTFSYGANCLLGLCQVSNNYFGTYHLNALLNGQQIGTLTTFSPISLIPGAPGGAASYTPATRLPDGNYTLNAQVQDAFGRFSNTLLTGFTVDTVAPKFLTIAPPDGSVFLLNPQITVSGSIDDATAQTLLHPGPYAILASNPQSGSNFSFPIKLAPGSNPVALTATDYVGNFTHAVVNLTFIPFSLNVTAPTDGAIFGVATVTVSGGYAGAPSATVKVNGVDAVVTGNTYTATVPLTYGSNTLTAMGTASDGATTASAAVTVTSSVPTLQITGPAEGATVNGDSLLVTGIFQGPPNTGVTVNGVVANVDNGKFYANNVPLQPGANTLTVTYTTADGQTTTQTRSVNSVGTSPIYVSAEPSQGIAPLAVTFDIENLSGNSIQQIAVDFDGNGSADFITADPNAVIQFTYQTPGIYPARVSVTDSAGNVYQQTFAVSVQSTVGLDSLLQSIWANVKSNLAAGQIEAALNYISPFQRDKYRTVLNNIAPGLHAMFGNFPAIYPTQMSEGDVEYFTVLPNNGINYGYYLYFMQDPDGVWRVHEL